MYFLSKNKRIALSSRAAKCLVVLFVLTYSFNISLAITDVQKLSVRSSFPVKLYCRTAYLLGINTEKCTNLDSSFSKEDTSAEIISLKERISYLESFFTKFSNANSTTTATSSSVVYFLNEKGDTGPAGPQGPMGLTGPQGSRGPQGLQGERGETVYVQATSSLPLYIPIGGGTGPQGPAGVDGKDGSYITDITSNSTSTTYFIYNPSANSTSSIIVPSSYIVSTSSTSTIIVNDYNFFASSSNSNLITFQNGDDITYSFTDTPIFSSSTITNLNTTNATSSNFFTNIIRGTQGFFTDLFTKNLTASTTETGDLNITANLSLSPSAQNTITNLTASNTVNTLSSAGNILTSTVNGIAASTTLSGLEADTLDGLHASSFSLTSHTHTFASLTSKPTTLAGYGITDAVPTSRTITAGNGLTGGGALSSNITLTLGTPSPTTLSSSDTVTTTSHSHSFAPGGTSAQYITGAGALATFPTIPQGTVTYVSMTVPTGLTVTGSPITTSGTLALGLASGYSIPTTAKQTQWDTAYTNSHTHTNKTTLDSITSTNVSNWNTAYGWGNHAGLYLPLSLSSGNIFVGNASNVATPVSVSGDITLSNTGVATIAPNSVALGTDTTGNYVAGLTAGTSITISGTAGEGWSPTVSVATDSIGDTQLAFNTGQHLTTASSPTFANILVSGLTSGYLPYANSSKQLTNSGIFYDGTKVGIGTTTPSNKLTVSDTADPLRLIGLQTGAGTDGLLSADANGVVRQISQSNILSSSVNTLTSTVNGLSSNAPIINSHSLSIIPDSFDGWTERAITPMSSATTTSWTSITSSADGTKLAATASSSGYIYTSTDSGLTWTEQTGSGQRSWTSITSSADGTKLAATVGSVDYYSGYIYTSTDSGVTWTERTSAGSRNWTSITSSADGTKLAAFPSSGYIFTSTDSGATWTQRTSAGSRSWKSITSSSDGTKLAAAATSNGYIYTSTNSGATWTQRTSAGRRNWASITSSADGTKLAAASYYGYIYTSTDSGATWTQQTSAGSRSWTSIISSSDGTKLAAALSGSGYIYISNDSGLTWTTATSAGSRVWTSITSSADGTKLAAVPSSGYIYTSIDGGVNWETIFTVKSNFTYIASSYDGTKLVAVSEPDGFLYTSTDSGATWTRRDGAGVANWKSVTSSADGTKLVAVGYSYSSANSQYLYYIYTSEDSGVTWTQRRYSEYSWTSITSSADGTKLAATHDGDYIETSTNSGANWTTRYSAGARNWTSITSSADGTKLAATASSSGYIYTSTNSGVNWTERTSAGARNWTSITSSSDGTKLAAFANGGYIYTSTDSGATWTERTSAGARNWTSITSSTDGTKLAAAVNGGYIYRSTDGGATWTQETGAGSRNWISISSSFDSVKLAAAVNGGYIYTSYGSSASLSSMVNGVSSSITLSNLAESIAGFISDFSPSDINLKKNIKLLKTAEEFALETIVFENSTTSTSTPYSALERLSKLRVVEYNWNTESDTDSKHIGFIAQNVEQIFSDLVGVTSDGMKGVNYVGFVPYIVGGMQEQVLILNGDKELINQNNFDSVLAEIRNEEGGEVEETFRTRVQNGFSVLFDFVAARITAIRGYFEEIFAKKITTETLKAKVVCVEKADGTEFCVSGEEVERVFGEDANIYSAENITTSDLLTASSTEVIEEDIDSSTTTAPINDATSTVDSTASSTEDTIIPEPVAEPVPEEPVPEEPVPESTETAPIDDAISTVDSTASSIEEILP